MKSPLRLISLSIVCVLFASSIMAQDLSCTIVMTNDGKDILAGNNEDYWNMNTFIWYHPARGKEYGRVCVGYDSAFAFVQGGMNDQGLFIDANAVSPAPDYRYDESKPDLVDNVMDYILAHCNDVNQAAEVFEKYNIRWLENTKFPVADASGNSIVVEWGKGKLQIIRRTGKYQISTNFVQTNFARLEDYPCYRYKVADKILSQSDCISVKTIEKVLSATHQGTTRRYVTTLYSNICDLTTKTMYLYYFHSFDEPVTIDLATELQKGKHGVRIADLFPIKPFSSVTYEELVPRPGRTVLKQIIDSSGIDSALSAYDGFKTDYISKRTTVDISEDEINELGYNLMRQNRFQDAIKVFQLNVREHPDAWNPYDSLGEAFMNVGDKENAIKNYEQSVKLNPNNQSGINALRKLRQ